MNAVERFWPKVDRRGPDECWEWRGTRSPKGYGMFAVDRRAAKPAHRFAYTEMVGAIPSGLVIDHLCRNRACCNPAHMEPVTNKENVLRGVGITAECARKTACIYGHPFTAENTVMKRHWRGGMERKCIQCCRDWMKAKRRGLSLRGFYGIASISTPSGEEG